MIQQKGRRYRELNSDSSTAKFTKGQRETRDEDCRFVKTFQKDPSVREGTGSIEISNKESASDNSKASRGSGHFARPFQERMLARDMQRHANAKKWLDSGLQREFHPPKRSSDRQDPEERRHRKLKYIEDEKKSQDKIIRKIVEDRPKKKLFSSSVDKSKEENIEYYQILKRRERCLDDFERFRQREHARRQPRCRLL